MTSFGRGANLVCTLLCEWCDEPKSYAAVRLLQRICASVILVELPAESDVPGHVAIGQLVCSRDSEL